MSLIRFTTTLACLFLTCSLSCLESLSYASPDPIGETADYTIVKGKRTSSMIRSGFVNTLVSEAIPDHPEGPAFRLEAEYEARVLLYGHYAGNEDIDISVDYFKPEFLEELRENGQYESESFKVKHLGYRTASLYDGSRYEDCDYLLFYDIKTDSASLGLQFFIKAALGRYQDGVIVEDVKDLKVYVKVKPDIPVLGAVQLDVSGKVNGVNAKAGLDYVKPARYSVTP